MSDAGWKREAEAALVDAGEMLRGTKGGKDITALADLSLDEMYVELVRMLSVQHRTSGSFAGNTDYNKAAKVFAKSIKARTSSAKYSMAAAKREAAKLSRK